MHKKHLKTFAFLPILSLALLAIACTSENDEPVTTNTSQPTSETAFLDAAQAASDEAAGMTTTDPEHPVNEGQDRIAIVPNEVDDTITLTFTHPDDVESLPTSFTGTLKLNDDESAEFVIESDATLEEESIVSTIEEIAAAEREAWELRLTDIWDESISGVVLIELETSVSSAPEPVPDGSGTTKDTSLPTTTS